MTPLVFTRSGRNTPTLLAMLAVWALLLAVWVFFNAAWWILALLGVFTLPALYDLVTNPVSRLSLSDHGLVWQNRRQSIDLPLARIKTMRLDTRWDFSVRATALLTTGSKLRVPPDCMPPHKALETALQNYGVKTERHHFTAF